MVYFITYDISEDRNRGKIAQYLERNAQRVQESVFECRADSKKIRLNRNWCGENDLFMTLLH